MNDKYDTIFDYADWLFLSTTKTHIDLVWASLQAHSLQKLKKVDLVHKHNP